MGILNLIVGLCLFGIGFLVKTAPNLIAGYNTMSKDKKKNVDIEGLSTFMRNGLITMGSVIITGYYLFKLIGFSTLADSMVMIVTLIGTIILIVKAQKYDNNEQKKNKLIYIPAIVITFVFGFFCYAFLPTKTIINDGTLRFTGLYGFEMRISDIENVELTEKIPTIEMRTNGFSFGHINKGTYKLKSFGKSKLFLNSANNIFMIITSKNGKKIITNDNNPVITKEHFMQIKALIDI
ncbi:MAG: DUF3784 domain-containing protein [Bacteroidales bacterium]|nr:DUF3784 domain-containing protein [Bacteroidales bacterium]